MRTLPLPAKWAEEHRIDGELACIEKLMADRCSDYWRGSRAEGIQQRYRDLTNERAALNTRQEK